MSESKERRKRRRWGDAPPDAPTATNGNTSSSLTPPMSAKDKAAALQTSISARLAALKAKKAQAQFTSIVPAPTRHIIPSTNTHRTTTNNGEPPSKKAKVYDLDLSITAPTFRKVRDDASLGKGQVQGQVPQKKINPYLAHLEQTDYSSGAAATTESTTAETEGENSISKFIPTAVKEEEMLDNRLAGGNIVKKRRKKELKFVEPGTFIHRAERKRAKVENATKSGFVSGRKAGMFIKSTGMAGISNQEDMSYYGHTKTMDDFSTIAKRVPRVDSVNEANDGSSKSTGGVVVIPTPLVMEWWDVEFLPSKLKKEVAALERKAMAKKATERMKLKSKSNDLADDHAAGEDARKNMGIQNDLISRCFAEASIQYSKTYKLIQHPVPVIPPNAPKEAAAPTLHLTKKEMKRQRKLRRAEKQRELQDLQAAGLIPAPEPKLTLSNFMKVLGDQAVMDPSKMEAKVTEQIHARRLKHEKMNAERKLTKEQRSEKREKKLTEDTGEAVSVALFLVKDMSHRYHRTKVDLNAQQNKITGGVLECENPKMSLVICEGGPKAVKRYTRLMTVRMKWKGEGVLDIGESDSDNDGDDLDAENVEGEKAKPQKFSPNNSCELVWTGMAPKRMFRTFVFQACESSEDARRVLEAKGVAHFWDQVVVHASGSGDTFNFKLGGSR
eukprot:scaffold2858_cov256-Chaetoceros_neogracile.AAC.7